MDKVNRYRQAIRNVLESFVNDYARDSKLVFDGERDRYLVMHDSWRGAERSYGCTMHMEIIEEKIWIQHNGTEIYVDRELVILGVDPRDIILGFRQPCVREMVTKALVNSYPPNINQASS